MDFPTTVTEDALCEKTWQRQLDPQGIQWDRLRFRRSQYREQRLHGYRNYTNIIPEARLTQPGSLRAFHQEELGTELTASSDRTALYAFHCNCPEVKTNIYHFQLRNLLWAPTSHEVVVVHNKCLRRWNLLSGAHATILDFSGESTRRDEHGLGLVHLSTCCARHDVVAAGGFNGEVVVATESGSVMWGRRISAEANCITNGLELRHVRSGALAVCAANNDDRARVLDAETGVLRSTLQLGWAANGASLNPVDRNTLAVIGDDTGVHLFDLGSGRATLSLRGHLDWSFAIAWHPGGHVIASGNQDCTTRVWDARAPGASLAVLPARLGSVRSLRFSADGAYLAAAEPADYVHVYDVASGFADGQAIDFFGEVSGIAFDPDGDALFVGIADPVYNSVLAYQRVRRHM